MLHMTCELGHVTCDMSHMVWGEHSLNMPAHTVWERKCFENIFKLDDGVAFLKDEVFTGSVKNTCSIFQVGCNR